MIIFFYVDDLLITGSSKDEIASLKDAMNHHPFSMIDLGLLSQFLGLKIAQYQHGIKVHQYNYALYFLNKFDMKYCKPRKNPFLSGVKLEEAVSVASRYMDQPHEIHWRAAKRIPKFVQGTRTHGIFYKAKSNLDLIGFT